MNTLSILLEIYLLGILAVAIRYGYHMIFELDKYDWTYSRESIWVSFILSSVLWPILLIRPRLLLDPAC